MRLGLLITAAFSVLLLNKPVYAQQRDLIERTFSGASKEANPQSAKKDIQDQASQKISEDIIKDLIGNERFMKNKTKIQSSIVKNSARYIPFSKPSQMTQEGDEFKMSVSLKISLPDLKQMLQNNALLNENNAIPVVLPLISWIDRVEGRSYRWWLPGDKAPQSFLIKESRSLEEALRSAFRKDSFYVIKPIENGLGASVPNDFQSEKLNSDDLQLFSQYFNAPVVIDGQIILNKGESKNYRIEIRLTAIQVSNGQDIADVSRRFETDPGSFEGSVDKKFKSVVEATANDLASQVVEAWQRGSLGTSVIRLTIKGKNTLPMLENFKDKARGQITQIKNIKERLISSDSVSYELNTSVMGNELISKLESIDVNGKRLSKVSESSDELVFKWVQ